MGRQEALSVSSKALIGPNPPNAVEEGVTLVIPDVINFNHSGGGGNVYIQTS